MITGSLLEIVIPGVVAAASVVLWLTIPSLRRNPVLRGVLIVSVLLTAALAMVTGLVVGVFMLSSGMEDF